jgi:hypothetical protein
LVVVLRPTTLTVVGILFAGALLAGAAVGETPPVLPTTGQSVAELYVAGSALGGPMTPESPTAEKGTQKSLIASAINPGLGTTVLIGTFQPETDFVFASDTAATIYLVASTAMAYDQIQVNLVGTGLTGMSSNTPLTAPAAIQTTITQLRLAIPTLGQALKAGTKVSVNVVLFGIGAGGTPTELYLVYGSAKQATGLDFSMDRPGAFPSHSSAFAAFMADKSLTLVPPTATADKSASAYAGSCTGSCMGSVPAWDWGKTTSPTAFTVAAETVFAVWLAPPGGAGAMRGFTVTLFLGKTSFATGTGTIAKAWSDSKPTKYVFNLATRGAQVAPGDDIKIQFAAWTTGDAGEVRAYYGSVVRPAGLMIPIVGGGPAASDGAANPVTLSAPSTGLSGPAGGVANGSVLVANPGKTALNLTLNATGNVSVAFRTKGPYAVAANKSTTVNFTVDLGHAAAGKTYPMALHAWIDGKEVGNLSYTVTASGASANGGPASTGKGATSTNAKTNESANAKTADGKKGIPAPGAVLVVGAFAIIAILRRRRA